MRAELRSRQMSRARLRDVAFCRFVSFANGDLRASERTFQLLFQVTGRAGRSGRKSIALLQTYQPEETVLKALINKDREGFYAGEIENRKKMSLPPFGRLAALIISGKERECVKEWAQKIKKIAPYRKDIELLGPTEAPLALIRGRYRFRLLIHAQRAVKTQIFIKDIYQMLV